MQNTTDDKKNESVIQHALSKHFCINTVYQIHLPTEGGLNLLHEVDNEAVIWLESTATAALAKQINN